MCHSAARARGVGREPAGAASGSAGEDAALAAALRRPAPSASRAWYSTSSAAWPSTAQRRAARASARGSVCATRSDGGVQQLDGRRAGGDQRRAAPPWPRAGRRRRAGRCAACGSAGTVRKVASATKAERALAADDQVGEDVDRAVVVEERVEAVAHRVLHRELLLDGAHRVPGCRGPGRAAARGPAYSSGSVAPQPLVGVGRAGVDDRAARQHERRATPACGRCCARCRRPCPLELLATTPPMVQAISLAGSGPSLRPCRGQAGVDLRTVAPGCTRTRAPSSSTSTRAEVPRGCRRGRRR